MIIQSTTHKKLIISNLYDWSGSPLITCRSTDRRNHYSYEFLTSPFYTISLISTLFYSFVKEKDPLANKNYKRRKTNLNYPWVINDEYYND